MTAMRILDTARFHWQRHPLRLVSGFAITLAGLIAAMSSL